MLTLCERETKPMTIAHDDRLVFFGTGRRGAPRRSGRGSALRARLRRWAGLAPLLLVLAPTPLAAARLELPDTPYTYTIIDQDLAAALHEFGSNLNIKVNVSPEVKGRIQGRLPEMSPRAYLDRLSALYNFDWYYDGLVLHITSVREAQSRLLVLSPLSFDELRHALDALGVSDSRYVARPAPGNGLALVAGPPRFVTLVEQTLAGLIAEDQARPKASPVAVPVPTPTPVLWRDTLLTVFRGSEMTIIRDGRPERFGGPDEYRRTAQSAERQVLAPVVSAQ